MQENSQSILSFEGIGSNVIAQLSSCSVERVFSKLKNIRNHCGENMYDDKCEVRLFLQCNGDLSKLADKMKKCKE